MRSGSERVVVGLHDVLPDPAPRRGDRQRIRLEISAALARRARRYRVARTGFAVAAGLAIALVALYQLRSDGAVTGAPRAADAGSIIALRSGAQLFVREGSDLAVVDPADSLVRLRKGLLLAHVAKRSHDRPFTVLAGDVRVEVVGTKYAVGFDAAGSVGVRVFEGTVRVTEGDRAALVHAGESWPATGSTLDVRAGELVRLDAAPDPVLVVDAPPAPAVVTPVPAPASVSHAPAPAAAVARPHHPDAPSYREARQIELAGNLTAAIAAYQAVVALGGQEAEDALYAIGRLQIDSLGERDAGAITFNDYRSRYPNGRYARAVDVHVIDLAVGRGDDETALNEADRFLAQHADDPRAARFRYTRAAIRARRGDCRGAMADLDQTPPSAATADVKAYCARAANAAP